MTHKLLNKPAVVYPDETTMTAMNSRRNRAVTEAAMLTENDKTSSHTRS